MKWKFHHHKNLILLEYVDAGSVLISTMDSSGKKKKILVVSKKMMLPMLPKTSVYVKIMMIKLKG